MNVAVPGLDLLSQDLMAGLLAEEDEEFADGVLGPASAVALSLLLIPRKTPG